MAFDASGNVTGTGNTLADAVGVVSGITSQVIGGLTIYSLDLAGNPYINIQNGGFLTIDPRSERVLIISYPTLTSTTGLINVMSGGTFTGGFDVSSAGTDKYTQGEIITSGVAVGSGGTVCCGIWHLLYGQTGSNIILLGVTIASGTYWKTLGNTQFRDLKHLGINSTAQIRLGGGTIDVDVFEVHGFSLVLNVNLTGSDVFNGFKPVLSALTLSVESTSNSAPQVDKPVGIFGNVDNSFNAFRSPVSLWQKTAGYVLPNLKQGGLTAQTPQNTSASSYGFIEQYKDFELTVKDGLGNLIDGAIVYVPKYTFSETISASDNTFHGRNWAEKSYNATTLNGVANIDSFLYKIQHTQPSATTYYVYADKVGSGIGTIDFRIKAYGKLITIVADVTCDDINRKIVNATSFDDVSITETNPVTVANYPVTASIIGTTLTITGDASTLQSLTSYQLYDFIDLYLYTNYAGETETIITRELDTINARDLNVVLDYITFSGSITTTLLVTLQNGSTVSGNISDVNGDSSITVTTPVGYDNDVDIYNTLADAENQVNQIATGLYFRYLFAVYGGQTIWYRMTQLDGSYIIESYLIPVPSGNYQVSLVVTSENAALGEIKAVTDKIDRMLEVIGGEQVFRTTAMQNVPQTDLIGIATSTNVTDSQIAIQTNISNLNDFNPTSDVVANVTLVDTVTVNLDMRGTDGSNTISPDNTSITDIKTKVDTLENTDLTPVKKNTDLIPATL